MSPCFRAQAEGETPWGHALPMADQNEEPNQTVQTHSRHLLKPHPLTFLWPKQVIRPTLPMGGACKLHSEWEEEGSE